MPRIHLNDLEHLREEVFFDGPATRAKLSRFWLLLTLSSVIAAAGVVGDSTATVIGAMIVAPLMLPIMGTMLAVILGDRRNLLRSVGLVVTGALAAIAIGFALGMVVGYPVNASTNAQVAARVTPRLIDLVAALATGAVGSVALVRRDISDTLPGVAIAISLVPPLTVVGLTLESGEPSQAAGALLLFVTNVVAILFVGIVVMALYRVNRMVPPATDPTAKRVNRRNAVAVIVALVVVVVVPLAFTSVRIAQSSRTVDNVRTVSTQWAEQTGMEVVSAEQQQSNVVVRFAGPLPFPDTASLKRDLQAAGIDPAGVVAELVPLEKVDFSSP